MYGHRTAQAPCQTHGNEVVEADPYTWDRSGDVDSNPRRVWP
jgi:hypothetical protein